MRSYPFNETQLPQLHYPATFRWQQLLCLRGATLLRVSRIRPRDPTRRVPPSIAHGLPSAKQRSDAEQQSPALPEAGIALSQQNLNAVLEKDTYFADVEMTCRAMRERIKVRSQEETVVKI